MVRQPIVDGQFYSERFEELEKQITESFMSEFGPGDLPTKRNDSIVKGVISPHAGYVYSGPGAAWSHKAIAESAFPDVFIMLGVDHSGFGSGLSIEDWKTPLGLVKSDKDLIIAIKEKTSLKINEMAHAREHSIEVQLPFLQFCNKDLMKDIKIIPITVSSDIDIKKTAEELKSVLKSKNFCIIASSDFTHYGMNYGFVPFQDHVKEKMEDLDKRAIAFIADMDPDGFLDYVEKTGATICGALPISLMINILKGSTEVKLEQYYTSGDIVKNYSNAVGYASIVFK